MAIYHFSVQAISRGKGQSAVASASYRSGEKLIDENSGETKFYQREVKPDTMILSPKNAPDWVQDRQSLWNEVEKIESNKNSRLAREINVALPIELSHGQQKELIKNFAQEQFVDRGMVADIAIHRDDKNNPHAHIMLTIRPFEKNGEWLKQKSKKEYILDENGDFTYNKKGQKRTRKIDLIGWDNKELVQEWRKEWANHANKALEQAQVNERIDHRSHAERGLETKPTQHLGHIAHAMEKKGVQTDRGNYNREVESYNQTVVELQQYKEQKKKLEREQAKVEQFSTPEERTQLQSAKKFLKAEPSFEAISKRLVQLTRFEAKISREYKALDVQRNDFRAIKDHFSGIISSENRIKNHQEEINEVGLFKGILSKHSKQTKAWAENEIRQHEAIIKEHERKLIPYQKEYKFSSYEQFEKLYKSYHENRPQLLEKNRNQRGAINRERDVLQKANIALENRFVRELATKYPNHPEMAYLSYKQAKAIDTLNKKHGKILSQDDMKHIRDSYKKDYQTKTKQINHAIQENNRLNKVSKFVNGYQEANAVVEHYENNLVYRGKLERGTLSKADQNIYENALSERTRYKQLLMQHHVKDGEDLHQQKEKNHQLLEKVPQMQEQADYSKQATGLFDSLVQGIEQAQQAMEQQKQQTKNNTKQKYKYKQKNIDLELG